MSTLITFPHDVNKTFNPVSKHNCCCKLVISTHYDFILSLTHTETDQSWALNHAAELNFLNSPPSQMCVRASDQQCDESKRPNLEAVKLLKVLDAEVRSRSRLVLVELFIWVSWFLFFFFYRFCCYVSVPVCSTQPVWRVSWCCFVLLTPSLTTHPLWLFNNLLRFLWGMKNKTDGGNATDFEKEKMKCYSPPHTHSVMRWDTFQLSQNSTSVFWLLEQNEIVFSLTSQRSTSGHWKEDSESVQSVFLHSVL